MAIWQHNKRVLGLFSLRMRRYAYLRASGQKSDLAVGFGDPHHTLARRRSKSMEKAKIRPIATPKPLNRSSQKLADVITSWTAPGMQNFVTIGSGVSVPQIRDFAVLMGWLFVFWGFFNKATAYTAGRIFTQNTSNDVVPSKEVPFGSPDDYILYLDP